MGITNDQWKTKALEVHSIISLKISRQFILLSDADQYKKKDLKQALALIDQLDFFLESFPAQQSSYKKTYGRLLEVLKTLGLHDWAMDTLSRRFGAHCFFVHQVL
ncbi:MAG: hypothetical protein KBD23_01260 [Gammaproteobacteria bacterium]|nr:hypothetical protein [Gammaproteobacteria bacterium]